MLKKVAGKLKIIDSAFFIFTLKKLDDSFMDAIGYYIGY